MEASQHTGAFPAADGLPWGVCKGGGFCLPAHQNEFNSAPPKTSLPGLYMPHGKCPPAAAENLRKALLISGLEK